MFNLKVKISDNVKTVTLEGRIDMSNANECEETVLQNLDQVDNIVLDLAGLTFIDSTGIGSLISAIQSAHNKNIRFELANIPEGIEQIFSIIGVFDILNSLNNS